MPAAIQRTSRAAVAAAEKLDLSLIDENRIRSSAAGLAASKVAVIPAVREVLRRSQMAFAADPKGAVLDGRDIGTVICPNADVKLFVTASLEERTRRRLTELHARGEQISFEELQDADRRAGRARHDPQGLAALSSGRRPFTGYNVSLNRGGGPGGIRHRQCGAGPSERVIRRDPRLLPGAYLSIEGPRS